MDKDEDGRRHREAQEERINRRMAEQMEAACKPDPEADHSFGHPEPESDGLRGRIPKGPCQPSGIMAEKVKDDHDVSMPEEAGQAPGELRER